MIARLHALLRFLRELPCLLCPDCPPRARCSLSLAAAEEAIRRGSEAVGPVDARRAGAQAISPVRSVQIATRDGSVVHQEARETGVCGLLATRCSRETWRITHEGSGHAIGSGKRWPSAEEASAAAREWLGPAGKDGEGGTAKGRSVDWTRSAAELLGCEDARAAVEKMVRAGDQASGEGK